MAENNFLLPSKSSSRLRWRATTGFGCKIVSKTCQLPFRLKSATKLLPLSISLFLFLSLSFSFSLSLLLRQTSSKTTVCSDTNAQVSPLFSTPTTVRSSLRAFMSPSILSQSRYILCALPSVSFFLSLFLSLTVAHLIPQRITCQPKNSVVCTPKTIISNCRCL
jgi:hypothetical protein